jgi:rubrerythrin
MLNRVLNLSHIRREIASMESETKRFYAAAAQKATTVSIRQLLDDLGQAASKHQRLAESLEQDQITSGKRKQEDEAQRRTFVLQVVQPGLAGLMDGYQTLAPVFAAAFAIKNSWDAFLVGMAASIGAGISMGFAEELSTSLHGYPASFRHFPGSFGWSPGLYNRYSNRLCLAAVQHPSSNWPIPGQSSGSLAYYCTATNRRLFQKKARQKQIQIYSPWSG